MVVNSMVRPIGMMRLSQNSVGVCYGRLATTAEYDFDTEQKSLHKSGHADMHPE